MFLAMGVGAWSAGIFHLMTHAFFKGLLFLGAGSVIHGMGGEQDIRRMGGLRTKMPVTFWTFAIACAAIAGVPFFAGFFSKDAILYQAFTSEHGHPVLWAMGVAGAVLTAFYMFRLLFMTFFGEIRADPHTAEHVHESPASMTVPLVILAVLSIVGGWVGLPAGFLWGDLFGHFLEPVVGGGHHGHHSLALELGLMAVSILAAAVGIVTAYVFYVRSPGMPKALAARFYRTHRTLLEKYRIDELYDRTAVRLTFGSADVFWKVVDVRLIDGLVNGVAAFVRQQSRVWRLVQTGDVQHYAFTFLLGVIVLVGYFWVS